MGNVDEVIELHTALDARGAKNRTVNGTVGTEFDVIFYDDIAVLIDFNVFAAACMRKPKTVRTDNVV